MTATTERRLAALEVAISPAPARRSPVEVAHELSIVLDPWQRDLALSEWRQAVVLCSRQSGKSTIAGIIAITVALYAPGSTVLIVSPSERQSGLLFRSVLKHYRRLGHPVAAEVENRLSLELANGSQVFALPGSEATVRGFSSVDLLIEDEASRVDDELHAAIRPMLAVSRGRLLLLSTPAGKRGHFYRAWAEGGADWHRTRITALDCPRIDPDWLAAERAASGDFWFRQEFLCEFLDDDTQLYATDLIEGALTPAVAPFLPAFSEVTN